MALVNTAHDSHFSTIGRNAAILTSLPSLANIDWRPMAFNAFHQTGTYYYLCYYCTALSFTGNRVA